MTTPEAQLAALTAKRTQLAAKLVTNAENAKRIATKLAAVDAEIAALPAAPPTAPAE